MGQSDQLIKATYQLSKWILDFLFCIEIYLSIENLFGLIYIHSMNAGKSSQIGKHGFGSLHNLTYMLP